MATVQSRDRYSIDQLINETVVDGEISDNGHLLLKNRGGAVFDAGQITDPSFTEDIDFVDVFEDGLESDSGSGPDDDTYDFVDIFQEGLDE